MGEGNGTAADAADMGDERVAVRDGNARRERSGEDHFAGTEGHAAAAKRVRKPCHRIPRRALDGRAAAGRYRFAILSPEVRPEGKECANPCQSRWSPHPQNKNKP